MEDLREWILSSLDRDHGIPRSPAIHHYCVNPHPSREVSTATNLKIHLEQQGYLHQVLDILNNIQQGRVPTQLHQQIQHLEYRRKGFEVCPDKIPSEMGSETENGIINIKVHLMTITQKHWTMY